MPYIPDITDTQELERLINYSQQAISKGKILFQAKEVLLPQEPEVIDTQDIDKIIRLSESAENIQKAFSNIDLTIPEIPVLADTSDIIRLGVNLSNAQKIINAIKLPDIPQQPDITDTDLAEKILDVVEQGKKAKAELDNADNNVKKATVELDNLFKQLGICPLCGQQITDNTLAHLHAS